ncbi:MAG: hypothetical protein WDM77_10550 [Steroidobacteraceae bacterium]
MDPTANIPPITGAANDQNGIAPGERAAVRLCGVMRISLYEYVLWPSLGAKIVIAAAP